MFVLVAYGDFLLSSCLEASFYLKYNIAEVNIDFRLNHSYHEERTGAKRAHGSGQRTPEISQPKGEFSFGVAHPAILLGHIIDTQTTMMHMVTKQYHEVNENRRKVSDLITPTI